MRDLVAEHDARFRAAIEANDGYVVKGTGDGFHAAFSRAGDAVKAAEQLQAATADLPTIKVRIGINTGEVQERDGDYFGPAVNRAARIMAAGHGGQVLLAGVTADLVPGLTLRNLGEHRLPRPRAARCSSGSSAPTSSRRCARSTSFRATCRCSARASSAAPTR